MTHEPLARALCAAHCRYLHMSPDVLPGYVERNWREWVEHVPAVLDAARAVLAREQAKSMPQLKVMQTKLHDPENGIRGNCLAACLSTVFHIPLDEVPAFEDMSRDTWLPRLRRWLLSIERTLLHFDEDPRCDFLYLANGKSPRGVYHSVVYLRGELYHDPHPSQDGIISAEWFEVPCDVGWIVRKTREAASAELTRDVPLYGLDGGAGEPFVLDHVPSGEAG